ncbi:family 43 glycosylhydrolase [Hymenobacter jejuensis]|uniref:family 43 glycosylhydrolase n=1 Tax=Hymenobacter jejuensis TaxID=2502781 RepID=UPI001E517E8A|nr:family 43 glycosylhydrolase [Hymenobacter jejuensis]
MTSLFSDLRKGTAWLTLTAGLLATACQRQASTNTSSVPAAVESAQGPTNIVSAGTSLVLPGDFPDPSVTKIGDTYWATATSSNWGPIFPLLKSKNLTDWELVGHVFPNQPPDWADYYFWAPEISEENGKTYVFYTAHKKNGPLSVGVASADNPAGPYRDHGPLVGQEDGSIDAFPIRDENNQLYIVWKEDGNSQNRPTPIWAQRINDDRTALTGEKTELFRNTIPWEGNLVEGASIVRHGDYFYAFYAGNGCCGHNCTYGIGVARSRKLLGPWEKYEKNPILTKNGSWTCPGHGTVTQRDNRWFLLHHAYDTRSFEFVGRQGVLSEFVWTPAGWPEFPQGANAAPAFNVASQNVSDDFKGTNLVASWQWPIEQKPTFTVRDGKLLLSARPDHSGAALGHHTYTTDYTATTTLLQPAALPTGTVAGIAALGDPDNTIALTAGDGKLRLWQLEKGKQQALGEVALPNSKALMLRLQAQGGNQYRFSWSADAGKTWQNLPANGQAINGTYLPPWDRGVRAGLLARGPATATATFDDFTLNNQ